MIILDTNVISALMTPQLNPAPIRWLDVYPANLIWTTAISVFEVRGGIRLLPAGKRRESLDLALDALLETLLADRALPFDHAAAEAAAAIMSRRVPQGRNIGPRDTQIAGIAVSRRAALATRNTKDFHDLDIQIINPWTA